MNKIIKELYYHLQENIEPDFIHDPEFVRCRAEGEQLWNAIAADLSEEGGTRLDALFSAEQGKEEFWRFALFCRALALGISLGRLDF